MYLYTSPDNATACLLYAADVVATAQHATHIDAQAANREITPQGSFLFLFCIQDSDPPSRLMHDAWFHHSLKLYEIVSTKDPQCYQIINNSVRSKS